MVFSFFENLSVGRIKAAMDLMDEKATWLVSGKPEHIPLAGTYTKQKLVDLLGLVGTVMPAGIEMTITSGTAEGDRVVVEAEVRGVSPAGKTYDNRICFVVEVRGSTIQSVREYYDTIHTNDVLFDRTYSNEALVEN
ncbi:hypothetical protein BCD48_08870 [Pseudofrankia sp. BMG5.36]|nr:hypothetical protein BCD48_08870 [Pseudofrankia sp. BMG5.36]